MEEEIFKIIITSFHLKSKWGSILEVVASIYATQVHDRFWNESKYLLYNPQVLDS